MSGSPGSAEARLSRLSARELEVLELMAQGLRNADIAVALSVTVSAVKFHVTSIFRKLEVTNRTEAAIAYLNAAGGAARPPAPGSNRS